MKVNIGKSKSKWQAKKLKMSKIKCEKKRKQIKSGDKKKRETKCDNKTKVTKSQMLSFSLQQKYICMYIDPQLDFQLNI